MAHFVDAAGNRISLQPLKLQIGETKEIGLWGFRDFSGTPLIVDVMTPTGQQCSEIASSVLAREVGNIRYYHVRGLKAGNGRLDAITTAVQMWDNCPLVVEGVMNPLSRLVQAIEDGDLRINRGDANVIRTAATGGGDVVIAPQIVDLLDRLLARGTLDVMSLLRRGQSQHGVVRGNKVEAKAVDIAGYRGVPVRLTPSQLGITVVTQIIERFPDGQFDLGFPRPVGGATGFNPSDDVFFSVPDQATAQQCWDGKISRTMAQMMQPARDAVQAAMSRSSGTFRILYPDGLNHLHVSVSRLA